MLPLPSYSVEVPVEYIGFMRNQQQCGDDWAMARFILATEIKDAADRKAQIREILKYNE